MALMAGYELTPEYVSDVSSSMNTSFHFKANYILAKLIAYCL